MIRVRASVTLACALTVLSVSTASATPVPRVTGPLTVTADSYPFGAADHQLVPQDLRKVGYVEEEYLVSGKANVYEWPAPGPAVVRTPDAPYTTRDPGAPAGEGVALQRQRRRRDAQPVEPVRPQHRLGDRRTASSIRNGDAWVGITGKPISVDALKNFDPHRYGVAVVREPAAARRPAQLPTEPRRRRQLAHHRERARLGHLQPGRRAAAQRRPRPTR